MKTFLVYLLLAVFLGSYVLVECGPLLSTCHPCASSLKREWKREACDGTPADCGQCLEGYFGESVGTCQPSSVINVRESKIAFVPNGATVYLECIFNQIIPECVWERRGNAIEIGGRYQYIRISEGDEGITDCSMTITRFKDFDAGEWKCSSTATSDTYAIPNINPYLHMTQGDIVTLDHSSQILIPVGESVILKCYFDGKVDCAWERRGSVIEVSGRYKYISDNSNGMNTKECSIQIDSVKDIDFGRWNCKSMADGYTHSILKAAVVLSKVKRSLDDSKTNDAQPAKSTPKVSDRFNTSASESHIRPALLQTDLNTQSTNSVDLNAQDAIITDSKSGPNIPLIAGVAAGITLSIVATTFLVIIFRRRYKQERINNGDVHE